MEGSAPTGRRDRWHRQVRLAEAVRVGGYGDLGAVAAGTVIAGSAAMGIAGGSLGMLYRWYNERPLHGKESL